MVKHQVLRTVVIDGANERVVTVTVTSREAWEPKLPPIAASLPVDPDAAVAAAPLSPSPSPSASQSMPALKVDKADKADKAADDASVQRPQLARGSKFEPTPETARLLRRRR
nr:hypothetical protein [Kofleriaceae bacterium]